MKHICRQEQTITKEQEIEEKIRQTKVVGAFPNDGTFLKLTVAILLDIKKEW
ncbi:MULTISPECIES: hypothetical protein [unclassified Thermosipho (in: thermotogales)]|uniref:hypothetical protein n=1 Tax=unclassified Thermosipho (in: thermotogales) TaxID=2676525 RepID=UPI0018CC7AE5|nr:MULTISPECIES: hypothetical protein [unclassified Thermosipho (in: thermotogales)]